MRLGERGKMEWVIHLCGLVLVQGKTGLRRKSTFYFFKNVSIHPLLSEEDKVFCSNASCTVVKDQLQYHESCLYKILAYCYGTTDLWKLCQNMTRGQSMYCRSSIVTQIVLTLIIAPVLHDLGKVILVASTFGPTGAELSKPQ